MTITMKLVALLCLVPALAAAQRATPPRHQEDTALQVRYLEFVTPSVDSTCAILAKAHGVTFGDPVAELGNARTAKLRSGGLIGVRAPMHDQERTVVRPYFLVTDIRAAVEAAAAAGATIAVPPMPIPGQGTIAITIHDGIECGLWQD